LSGVPLFSRSLTMNKVYPFHLTFIFIETRLLNAAL
jgi:hypothetical protein